MPKRLQRLAYGDEFRINVEDAARNRALQTFDVVSYLAGNSPLVNERVSASTGKLKQEPVFLNMGRHRDTVFAEPTDLYQKQLLDLDDLVKSDNITIDNLKKALGAFGSRTTSQLDNYRYGAGLDVHHDTSVASVRRALNHLPIPIQGQHLRMMAERGNVGNTHLTQELHAYLPPEHNAAHFAPVTGVAFKGDAMRNLGDVEKLEGPELVDHFFRVSGDMQTRLADHADEFARESRKVYARELKNRTGLEVKPEQLGSSAILPGTRVSVSKAINNETKKRLGAKGMRELSRDVSNELYPKGMNSLIPNAEPVAFSTPAQIEKSSGKAARAEIEGIRERAVRSNTEGLTLHPGSVDELSNAVKLRQLIDLFGTSL